MQTLSENPTKTDKNRQFRETVNYQEKASKGIRKGAISDSPSVIKNKTRSDLLCDLSSLTLSSTEVIELSSSNLTLTDDIDVVDLG